MLTCHKRVYTNNGWSSHTCGKPAKKAFTSLQEVSNKAICVCGTHAKYYERNEHYREISLEKVVQK